MTRPLGSASITEASSLLRTGPPARPATVLRPPRPQPQETLPLAARGGQCRDVPSHVPRGTRRSGSRRLHAGHHLASQRAPARLIPGSSGHPGFDAVCFYFDTSAAIRLRAPFPHRSPRTAFSHRSMWRFGASPRRATPKGQNLHLPRSTASRSSTYIEPPSAFVTHPLVEPRL